MVHFTAPSPAPAASEEESSAVGMDVTPTPSLDKAIRQKEAGNAHIHSKRHDRAAASYLAGVEAVLALRRAYSERSTPASAEELTKLNDVEVALRSNLALALNRLGRHAEAERHCTVALEYDEDNWKVRYRRSLAHEEMASGVDREEYGIDDDAAAAAALGEAETDLLRCIEAIRSSQLSKKGQPGALKVAEIALERVRGKMKKAEGAATSMNIDLVADATEQLAVAGANESDPDATMITEVTYDDSSEGSLSGEGVMSCSIPLPKDQRDVILRLMAGLDSTDSGGSAVDTGSLKALAPVAGESYFLIDANWWKAWCRHVDFFRDAEIECAVHRKNLAETEEERQQAIVACKTAMTGRIHTSRLLPPGMYLEAPIKRMKIEEEERKRKKANRRPSTASSSSTSSGDSDEGDNEWCAISSAFGPRPGMIDNSLLILKTDGQTGTKDAHDDFFNEWCRPHPSFLDGSGNNTMVSLRPNLVRGHHFECLRREVYGALVSWYGDLTPPICRRVEKTSAQNGSKTKIVPRIVLYPELQYDEISGLSSTWSDEEMTSSTPSIQRRCSACKTPGTVSMCVQCSSAWYCHSECQRSHWSYHKSTCKSLKASRVRSAESSAEEKKEANSFEIQTIEEDSSEWGRIGLNNLGNTCFMNSVLQCLSHSAPLTKYFLSNSFLADINEDNPLSSGGKMANAYSQVVKDLWMNSARRTGSISPTSMKRAIALFAHQFAGSNQHDSQEFVTYLLDALHEDLNRVRDAPYVEMPDALPGQKLTIAGAEQWDLYRRRNDSHVMDTFMGQFKSTCVCPKCEKISVKFDAFKDVSIQIPQPRITERVHYLFLIRSQSVDGPIRPMMKYGLILDTNAYVKELRGRLSALCGIPAKDLILCQVHRASSFEKVFKDEERIGDLGPDRFIAAYEGHPSNEPNIVHSPVVHYHRDAKAVSDQLPLPIMASYSFGLSCKQVWDHIWTQLRRVVGPDAENKKATLKIKSVDSRGDPIPMFKDMKQKGTEHKSSILPRESDEPIRRFLGKEGTLDYFFLSCDWSDFEGSFSAINTFEDHPSVEDAIQKQYTLGQVTLDRCFEAFTTPERLDSNNLYYCSNCKEHVPATKTMELWRLPNVLVVHLKRFEFGNAMRSTKDGTFVNFPLEGLDMSHYCAHPNATVPASASASGNNGNGKADDSDFVVDSIPAMYDLFGVVNHYGRMGFGHYTAFARRWDETGIDKEWAAFDDSSVRDIGDGKAAIDGSGVVSDAAYLLFYRRRVFT